METEVKDIMQSTTNKKEQVKLIKQQSKKLIQETKLLKIKMPRAQYDAYLDAHPIIKAVIAIDRGIPIAQTVLGAAGVGKLGKLLNKGKIPKQKNPFGGGFHTRGKSYP